VDTWKKKYVELNREYHKLNEDFTMVEAELESLKNKKVITTRVYFFLIIILFRRLELILDILEL
jgi:hypothetical protein